MANRIRTGDTCGFNKGRSSNFREGSRVRQTPEEGRRTYRPKCCGNKVEDNIPKTLNDKNHRASSQKFWLQLLGVKLSGISLFVWRVWAPNTDKGMCLVNLCEHPRPEVDMEKDRGMLVSLEWDSRRRGLVVKRKMLAGKVLEKSEWTHWQRRQHELALTKSVV